jgi:P4 family phage/plasmid primase-like protien
VSTIPLTPEQTEALNIARALAAAGVPVFVAHPDPRAKIGFRLPSDWQSTVPDPAVVDSWLPGSALCAVMGHGLDLLDIDPHKGGDLTALGAHTPTSYGTAVTPSGGVHSFMASIGVRSRDNVLPGVDVKAGDASGKGRGFAFIAPTVKPSKLTGQPGSYRWVMVPDTSRLSAVLGGEVADDSGAALRDLIAQVRTANTTNEHNVVYDGPDFDEMPVELQDTVRSWVSGALDGVVRELKESAGWSTGQTDDRGRGWEKLQADAALRLGRLARATWNDLDLAEAEHIFLEAAPVDGSWGSEDVALKWSQQHHRLDAAPWPDLRSASDRDAEAWRALGVEPLAIPAPAGSPDTGPAPAVGEAGTPEGTVPAPGSGDAVAARYFGPGGIQAATLAGDTLAFGPLRVGRDDIMWSYSSGVWSPGRHVVRDRLTRLLGQRFRTNYVGTVEAMVRANVDTITCDPVDDLMNFTNGLLDWRAGELRPHSPDVPSTVQLAVEYDPDAQCPAFEAFVRQVVPEDVVPTIWELIGYLMYSGNPLHKAVMLTGQGRNGKGTFLRVLESVLGSRNVTSVSLHDLVNTRFTTASLFGKLANIAGDIDATYMENTATFKGITGGDTISAEHKGRDRFDFKPWAVPLFSANKIPASADTSVGYLARWLVVPFPYSFIGREDRHLDAKLHQPEELRGIAARGVQALGALLDRGDFEVTASGEAAREEFVRRVDQVRTWLADCCEIHPELPWVARTALYEAYKTWAARDGHKAVRATEFYDRIEQAGGEPAIVHGTRGFKRIRVIDNGWATSSLVPVGAAGAPIPNSVEQGAQQGAAASVTASNAGASVPATQAGAVSAPHLHPHVSAGQPPFSQMLGAEGAGTPQPPYARVTQVGGLGEPAPSAPKALSASPRQCRECGGTTGAKGVHDGDCATGLAAQEKTEAARTKRAEAAAAKRLEAIAAASGALVALPALLTRDGTIRSIGLEQADALLATITGEAGHGELTVDVEHTGYPIGHRHYALRTIQLGDENLAVVLDHEGPDASEHDAVARRHLAAARVLHAHSASADIVPLAVAGLIEAEEAWTRMVDTGTLAKIADPALTGNSDDLKGLAKSMLGDAALAPAADAARAELFKAGKWKTDIEVTHEIEQSGWAQVDHHSETMARYDGSDVLDCAAIARRLPALAPDQLHRERTAQRMTARVAHTGFRFVPEQIDRLHDEHSTTKAKLAALIPVENPGSNDQLGAMLTAMGAALPRTGTGKPSVAKGVLEPIAGARGSERTWAAEATSEVQHMARVILDWRHADTALKLFLDPWRDMVRNGDGRARSTVHTLGADTGRMSSVRFNLQQISREGGMRACISADPGYLLITADFASVEIRVAAALSQDKALIEMLLVGVDLHAEIAKLVWGPRFTKSNRYMAKRKVFGRIYGQGVDGMARTDGAGVDVARSVISAMDAMTPGLTEWSRMIRGGVESGHTQYPTYAGRVIHLPKGAPHAGPNYAIQGTARELLIDALMRWEQTPWGHCTLMPVHDEILAMVPEDQAHEATEALKACMATELYGVPIVAEADEPSFEWKDSA